MLLCPQSNITTEELSEKTKVLISLISSIILGIENEPEIVTVNKVCQACGINLADFLQLLSV